MRAFIDANTTRAQPALVPEITLQLATEITPIWQASETWLHQHDLPPPYWAFAWPGSQALARYILDNPDTVRGRVVLDFAAGCGLAAIAAARAGAARAEASDIDHTARASTAINAEINGVSVTVIDDDLVGSACRWDLILCGDVCYEAPMTRHIMPWLLSMSREAEVWIADPGRAYLPPGGHRTLATYDVGTSLELEDRTTRQTRVLALSRPGLQS